MKKLSFNYLLLLAFAIVGLTFTSCGDDPVKGCTDSDADNYNADATEDNGTCSFAGLFEGDYDVVFDCNVLPFSGGDLEVEKTGDASLLMTIDSPTLPAAVPVPTTIESKTKVSAMQDLDEVDLSGVNPAWAGLLWNINVSGTFDRDPATGVISGPLTFTLVESTGLVPDPIVDTCTFTATPI